MAAIPGGSGWDGLAAMPRRSVRDPLLGVVAAAAAGTALAAAGCGITLLARRLGGGFAAAPPAALGWAVAAAGIPLVAAVDAAGSLGGRRWMGVAARVGLATAAVAVVPAAGTVGWPGRLATLAAFLVAIVAVLVPRPAVAVHRPRRRPVRSLSAGEPHPEPGGPPVPAVLEPIAPELLSSPPPVGFRQRLERYETATGDDCLRGRAVLSVTTGSSTAHAHIGFCPSFGGLPTVEVMTDYDGVEAEVAVAEVLPWGIRLECRLTEPADDPLEIPVDFQVRHTP